MPDNRINPAEEQDNLNEEQDNMERFESDTQKIIHRHLENEDDVITEDDIRSVRVGMTPTEPDTATMQNMANEDDEKSPEDDEDIQKAYSARNKESQTDNPVTPWDTVDPEA
jgi:hypothetical protein